jgi:hypothetical protein
MFIETSAHTTGAVRRGGMSARGSRKFVPPLRPAPRREMTEAINIQLLAELNHDSAVRVMTGGPGHCITPNEFTTP